MLSEIPYGKDTNGKCPHCRCTVFFANANLVQSALHSHPLYMITESGGDNVSVFSSRCPNCQKPIVVAEVRSGGQVTQKLVHPFNVVRTVPPEVPKAIQNDFLEAAAVLSTSQKASAALSRRCLQNLLTDIGYKKGDLNKQIEQAIKKLPTRLAQNLDAIRHTGNFAAHPMKYKTTGMIVDVGPEEAEWNLDVLEELFDYCYVQPKISEEKRKKLDAKLKEAGKPPLKKP